MDAPPATSSVTVLLPPALRYHAEGLSSVRVAVRGEHVSALIDSLDQLFPGMRFNLCLETGELRPFVNIFVDGQNIRYLQGLDTPVPTGATIHILHSVAGG